MTSRRSDNLYALITFQGQESWMQVTRIALWTSHDIVSEPDPRKIENEGGSSKSAGVKVYTAPGGPHQNLFHYTAGAIKHVDYSSKEVCTLCNRYLGVRYSMCYIIYLLAFQ